MIIKKAYFFSLILFCTILYPQEWTIVSTPDILETLSDIHFVSETTGWAAGQEGIILRTTDGGENWEYQVSNTDKDLAKVFFLDENYGWIGSGNNSIVRTGGTIIRTTDGGANWTEIDFSFLVPDITFNYCDAIEFTSATTGHMIAGKSKAIYLFKTTDGGETWSIKDSLIGTTSFLRWYDMKFYDELKGVIVGNRKNLQRYTTDGGETWLESTPIVDGFFKDLRSVRWLDANTVLAMGEGNEFNGVPTPIYKSLDGGINWEKKTAFPPNSFDRIKDSYFKDGLNGIAMGSNGFSLAFIYKTTDGGESWEPSSAPYAFGIRSVTGANDIVYALGTGSHIIKSTDFGTSWSIFPFKTTASINGFQFIGNKGYAVSRNSDFIADEEGTGLTWSFKSSYGKWDAGGLHFIDENTGFILKENRYIIKTTDGGATWYDVLEPLPFSSRNKAGGIHFPSPNIGYAWVSLNDYSEYHIFKTTDAGETWNEITVVAGPGYLSGGIAFFDDNTGFVAGPDTWLNYTTDGGNTWNLKTIGGLPAGFDNKDFEAVTIVDVNTAWCVGSNMIISSTDKGASWNYINHNISDIDSSFYTIAFKDLNTGYIGCYDGIILMTTDGGVTWSKDETFKEQFIFYDSGINKDGKIFLATADGYIVGYDVVSNVYEGNILPQRYWISQNYPNPFNPTTQIEFSLPDRTEIELSIYGINGERMLIAAEGEYPGGIHTIDINLSGLSSGVYFSKLTSEFGILVNKMILLK